MKFHLDQDWFRPEEAFVVLSGMDPGCISDVQLYPLHILVKLVTLKLRIYSNASQPSRESVTLIRKAC